MSMMYNHKLLIFIFSLILLTLNNIHGKFLINSQRSSIIVLRHIRLLTDDDYYRIRCPYNLKHLTLTLLNYSNEYCYDLYTKSLNNHHCQNSQSPCRFHSKSIRLNCHSNQPYSNHVDITYQCSFSSVTNENTSTISTLKNSSMILHAYSFPRSSFGLEETIGIFLIGLTTVFILWLTICCLWFNRCHHYINSQDDDGKCELLSYKPYSQTTDFTIVSEHKKTKLSGNLSSNRFDNIYLHVNPFENKPISSSSLKITQID